VTLHFSFILSQIILLLISIPFDGPEIASPHTDETLTQSAATNKMKPMYSLTMTLLTPF